MAKIRRSREYRETSLAQEKPLFDFLGDLDILDIVLYLGIVLVTLIVPFLYSRLTTENFLTPKEFVAKIAMGFLGAAFCIKFIYEGKIRLTRTSLDFPLALFFGFSILSLLWNYNIPSAIRDLRETFLICLLFPLIVNVVRYWWQFDGILWAMVFAGVATSMLGIMEAYNLYYRFDPALGWFVFARDEIFSGSINYAATYIPLFPQLASKDYSMMSIVSTFGNRNYLGTFSMFVGFIPVAFFFYYRNWFMKLLSLLMFVIMAFGMFITRCRAALLGIIVGVAYMFLMIALLNRDWRFVKRNAVFIGIVGFILVGVLVFTAKTTSFSMLDKLAYTFTMDRKASNTYERVWVWYATYQSFAHSIGKWLVGSGFGSFKHFFPLQEARTFDDDNKDTFTSVTFRQAHNDWLQLVSELGLIGLAIMIFIVFRYFWGIFCSIRNDLQNDPHGGGAFKGTHFMLIGLGAAQLSQLVAAVPDFPYHRIETALYAVIVLALVPLQAETSFFRHPLPKTKVADSELAMPFGLLGIIAGLLAINFEVVTWQADILVRDAEYKIGTQNPSEIAEAKKKLADAIRRDYLPGDPYLKYATILQMEGKGQEAMDFVEKSWKNINFNARSTYHSAVFRMMHIAYHSLGDRYKALEYAKKGRFLTCGDARSPYYFYMGKISMEMGDLPLAEWAFRRSLDFPPQAGPNFGTQAAANLAVVLATQQKWQEAYDLAASVSASIGGGDPTMLDIMGICASNMGMLATAETCLKQAIALRPDQPIYKRDLGLTLLRTNRTYEARQLLEEAFLAPGLPPNLKPEIETILASMSSLQKQKGFELLEGGKKEEGLALLKDLYAAKVVPEAIKTEVGSYLSMLKAFTPEKPAPQPASPTEEGTASIDIPLASPSSASAAVQPGVQTISSGPAR